MKASQTEELISLLADRWRVDRKKEIIDFTRKIVRINSSKYCDFNGNEFSFVSYNKTIRVTHLNFYKKTLSLELIKNLRKGKIDNIIKIIKTAPFCNKYIYYFPLVERLIALISETKWPVQFGFEVDQAGIPKFKFYISVFTMRNSYNNVKVMEVCDSLGIKGKKLKLLFDNESNFDVLGVDLINSGEYSFKIYKIYSSPFPISSISNIYRKYNKNSFSLVKHFFNQNIETLPIRHVGFLYRINKMSSIDSVKLWIRLAYPLDNNSFRYLFLNRSKRMYKWLNEVRKIVGLYNAEISYYSFEGDEIGVYFK